MKNIILLLILLLSPISLSAFEIQCDSPWKDILVALKKSPNTGQPYLLFLGKNQLQKYYRFSESDMVLDKEHFLYNDTDTIINLDFHSGNGLISSDFPIFRELLNIPLSNCTPITLQNS